MVVGTGSATADRNASDSYMMSVWSMDCKRLFILIAQSFMIKGLEKSNNSNFRSALRLQIYMVFQIGIEVLWFFKFILCANELLSVKFSC